MEFQENSSSANGDSDGKVLCFPSKVPIIINE